MASLQAEKQTILNAICHVLGEDGIQNQAVPLSYPPLTHQLRPDLLSIVESVELHLGIPCDRTRLKAGKPVRIDLYLPGRDLYLELDRDEHDLGELRALTLLYYPAGLPRGFSLTRFRALIESMTAGHTKPSGTTHRMNAGRALSDFVKDLYIEGQLGKALVRIPKREVAWLLEKRPEPERLARLREYLGHLAAELDLPALRPV